MRLSSGAEFVLIICGSIMIMPGLPKVPAAESIKLNDKGDTEGLFKEKIRFLTFFSDSTYYQNYFV